MPGIRLRDERTVVGFWLIVGALILAFFYIQPGWPRMGDGHGALSQTWLFRDALSKGEWPGWSFYWYGGWSFTRAYGPAFSAPSGFLDLILENPKRSVILVFLGWHWLALIGTYLLGRELDLSRYGALMASLTYAMCGQFSQNILRFGSFNLSIFYALFPFTLLFLSQALRGKGRATKPLVLALICQSVSILNHAELGLYALFATLVFAFVSLALARPRRTHRAGKILSLFALLSVSLTTFFLVQFYLTSRFTLLGLEASQLWGESTLNGGWIPELLNPDYSENHPWSVHYFGWVGFLLAGLGAVSAFKSHNKWGTTIMGLSIVGFMGMVFLPRLRLLNLFVLPFSLMAALGAEGCLRWTLSRIGETKRPLGGFVLVSLLAMGVIGDSCRLLPRGQYSYLPTVGYFESPETVESLRRSRELEGAMGRTLQIRSTLEASSWSDLEPLVTGFSTLAGGNPETAPKSWPYIAAFIEELVAKIHQEKDRGVPLEDLCLLLGVRYLAYPSDAPGRLGFGHPLPSHEAYQCLEMANYSPLIASTTFALQSGATELDRLPGSLAWRSGFTTSEALQKGVENLGLDRETLRCQRLLFLRVPDTSIPPEAITDLEVRFVKEVVSHTRVDIEFESSSPCFIQVSYAHDPRLEVRLDGQRVETVPTTMHQTGLVCPTAGKHHLEIRSVYLPLEKVGWGFSLASWLGVLGTLLFSKRSSPIGAIVS